MDDYGWSTAFRSRLNGYDFFDQIKECRESLDFAISTPTLLSSTRRKLATVPADHIFAIVGMMSKHTIEGS
jgi:hypothetical protein